MLRPKTTLPPNLRRAAEESQSLLSDLEGYIQDVTKRSQGWTVEYAVDYSEVFAYVEDSEDYIQFRLFSDDDRQRMRGMKDIALDYLFASNPQHGPVLLPPHVLELQADLPKLESREAAQIAQQVLAAIQADFNPPKRISELARRLDADPDFRPSQQDRDLIVDYSRQHATVLVSLLTHRSPAQRLRLMFAERQIRPLSSLDIGTLSFDLPKLDLNLDLYDLWFERLSQQPDRKTRPNAKSGNQRDATAIMLLEAIEHRLATANANGYLALMTRSPIMHRLYEEDFQTNPSPWRGRGLRLLRHPRALVTEVGDRDGSALNRLTALRDGIASLVREIHSFEADPDLLIPSGAKYEGQLKRRIHRNVQTADAMTVDIKTKWREFIDTIAMERLIEAEPEAIDIELLRALRDRRLFALEKLRDRVHELEGDIPQIYQIAAHFVGTPADMRNVVAQSPKSIDTHVHAVPYAFNFQHPATRRWSEEVMRTWRIKFADTFALLDDLAKASGEVERILAVAYYFAAAGHWATSLSWARLASSMATDDHAISESSLFLALCLRMVREGDGQLQQRRKEAAECMKRAMSVEGDDPRVIVENTAQLVHWWDHDGPDGSRLAQIIAETARALAILESRFDPVSVVLKLRARNNRCYALLRYGSDLDIDLAVEDHTEVVRLLHELSWEASQIPTSVRDTLLWARWRLRPKLEDAAQEQRLALELLAECDQLLEEIVINPERRAVNALRTLLKSYLADRPESDGVR